MKVNVSEGDKNYQVDFQKPIDISLPLVAGDGNPNCYWAEAVAFETIRIGDFVGSVAEGGSVNYQRVTFTPHGNGTHTECYGHLSADEGATLNHCLDAFHFFALLITVEPRPIGNDRVVCFDDFIRKIKRDPVAAMIIRTLPNDHEKKTRAYSGTNPPYLDAEITHWLAKKGVKHLLLDLPSVDKEVDQGMLRAHKSFWRYPEDIRKDCTITELIYVADQIKDGLYLLNLQVTSIALDASPSKPLLFALTPIE